MGKYQELQTYNREKSVGYSDKIFSFVRWSLDQKLVIVAGFDADRSNTFELLLPPDIIQQWNLKDGTYVLIDHLNNSNSYQLLVEKQTGKIKLNLKPLESVILEVKGKKD